MRELLTPGLAEQNPKAYTAHFRRLEALEQRQYLSALGVDDLKTHFKTLGELPTVGLILTIDAESFRLEATVGGSLLGEARGAGCSGLSSRALGLGAALEAKAVSGMLVGSLHLLPQTEQALSLLRWEPKTLVLAGDSGGRDCAPSLGWAMRGSIGESGTFYMPNEALLWDERDQVQVLLRALAERTGAVLDVRLG